MKKKIERLVNPCNKERKVDNPYEIYENAFMPGWQWRVLKKWQIDNNKPQARWFCAVKSPMTYGNWELGDTYVTDILQRGCYKLNDKDMKNLLEWEKNQSKASI